METGTHDPAPVSGDLKKIPTILWPWPYAFVLLLLGATGYGFYMLSTAPAVPLETLVANRGFAAIAYSRSTGEYGSASDCATHEEADKLALSRCKQPDAKIVAWSHDAWCALAVADDHNFGIAWGNNREDVERNALAHCREHTQSPCRIAVAVSAQGTIVEMPGPSEAKGSFGAIAYSRSTGRFGSSRDCATLGESERIALSGCNAPDAEIVIWCQDAYCALAIADDRAYGYSWGQSASTVEKEALDHCRLYAKTPCRLAVLVDSRMATAK